jgi:hypothetical protein
MSNSEELRKSIKDIVLSIKRGIVVPIIGYDLGEKNIFRTLAHIISCSLPLSNERFPSKN